MTIKKFKTKYLCVVHISKRKVYNFKRKRQEKYAEWNISGQDKVMPAIGFICEKCNEANNYENMYFVNKQVVHESCGMELVKNE